MQGLFRPSESLSSTRRRSRILAHVGGKRSTQFGKARETCDIHHSATVGCRYSSSISVWDPITTVLTPGPCVLSFRTQGCRRQSDAGNTATCKPQRRRQRTKAATSLCAQARTKFKCPMALRQCRQPSGGVPEVTSLPLSLSADMMSGSLLSRNLPRPLYAGAMCTSVPLRGKHRQRG